jgi:hypothetical protein
VRHAILNYAAVKHECSRHHLATKEADQREIPRSARDDN